jgi:hypothetical protein
MHNIDRAAQKTSRPFLDCCRSRDRFWHADPGRDSLSFAYLMALLVAALVLMAGLGWFERWWSLGGRILYSIVAAAGVIFLIWMVYWNVI